MTRSEWLRKHYRKDAEESEKALILQAYHDFIEAFEGLSSDPGSEED
jgi:hypothetical protein